MSKLVKQMEMDALKKTLGEVRDLVVLQMEGFGAVAENQMRLTLRKKNIRLHRVKNSLVNRILKDLGLVGLEPHLQGPTTLAWGSTSIADLSKEIDAFVKKNAKLIKPKAALADGAVVTFEAAKKFPTRAEAIARVLALALSPARRIAGQIVGPASRLAGQLKSLKDKAPEEAPAEAPAPAPA